MKRINLLPKEELRQLRLEIMTRQILSFWIWALVSLAFVAALAMGSSILLSQRIGINNSNIDGLRQALRTSATQQLEQEVSSLNRQIGLINGLRSDHYYWSNAFIELSYLVDSNTRLSAVNMDRATGQVKVSGVADDRDGVLAFWAAVKKSQYFKDIDFPLTNLEQDQDATFTFSFFINPEVVKQP